MRPGHGRGHSNAQPQATRTRGPSGGPARLGTEAGGEGGGGTGDGAGGGAGCRSGGDEGGSDIGGGVRAAGSVQAVSRQRWRDGWRREAEAARWRGDGESRRRRRRDEGVSDEGGDDGGGSCDGGDECSDLRQRASAHLSRQVKVGRGAGLVRTCRGRSGVRRKSAPEASDERTTSKSCRCRWARQRLSGAARMMQATFDSARPECGHQGGQRSVRSIAACQGGRRRGHAGRAARRRAAAACRHLRTCRFDLGL